MDRHNVTIQPSKQKSHGICRGSGKTTLYFCSAFCWCLGRNQFLGPGFVGCLRQFRGTFQNPLQVAVRIQAGFLSRFNQTVKDCATLRTARCIAEQKILPAHHKGLYAALGAVVGKLQPAVLQIAHQIGPLLQKIVQCLAQGGLGCCPGAGLICPCQQSLQNRFFLLQTLGVRRHASIRTDDTIQSEK